MISPCENATRATPPVEKSESRHEVVESLLQAFDMQKQRIKSDLEKYRDLISKFVSNQKLTEEEAHNLKVVIKRNYQRLSSKLAILTVLSNQGLNSSELEKMREWADSLTKTLSSDSNQHNSTETAARPIAA